MSQGVNAVGDQKDRAGDRQQRSSERIIEFGPDGDDALQATLRVLARLGLVVSIEKIDGSILDVVPVLVDGGQVLAAKWTRADAQSEETTIVQIAEIEHLRVL